MFLKRLFNFLQLVCCESKGRNNNEGDIADQRSDHMKYMTLLPSSVVNYKQLAKTAHVEYNRSIGFILILTNLGGLPNTRQEMVQVG